MEVPWDTTPLLGAEIILPCPYRVYGIHTYSSFMEEPFPEFIVRHGATMCARRVDVVQVARCLGADSSDHQGLSFFDQVSIQVGNK